MHDAAKPSEEAVTERRVGTLGDQAALRAAQACLPEQRAHAEKVSEGRGRRGDVGRACLPEQRAHAEKVSEGRGRRGDVGRACLPEQRAHASGLCASGGRLLGEVAESARSRDGAPAAHPTCHVQRVRALQVARGGDRLRGVRSPLGKGIGAQVGHAHALFRLRRGR